MMSGWGTFNMLWIYMMSFSDGTVKENKENRESKDERDECFASCYIV